LPAALSRRGIHALYSHQSAAYESARRGENVVLATGTASGKTLAYNLPVLATLLENPSARALYLFPTKALTQDQFATLNVERSTFNVQPAIYDGDTPILPRQNQANRAHPAHQSRHAPHGHPAASHQLGRVLPHP
jgi:DEAD/DEAH box helicase domain-containing protein